MFKPVKMLKIQVLGLKRDRPQIVEALHELGLVHVEECRDQGLETGQTTEEANAVNEELVRLYAVKKLLSPQPTTRLQAKPLPQVLREAKGLGIDVRLGELKTELERLDAERTSIADARGQLKYFAHFHVDLASLQANSATVLAGLVATQKMHPLRNALSVVSSKHLLAAKPLDKTRTVFLLAIEKGREAQARDALEKAGTIRLRLPTERGTPSELLANLEKRVEALKKRRELVEQEIGLHSRKHWNHIEFLIESLEIEKQRLDILQKFGRTRDAFVLEGFVPLPQAAKLKEALAQRFGQNLVVLEHEAEESPTLLDNPQPFAPFQFLMEFVSIPKSHEIDPTIVFTFALAVFYGAMLGDAGYGLLSLALAHLIVKKTEAGGLLNNVGKIWFVFSIPSIAFGAIYDEFFGFSHHKLLGVELYHGLERMESVPTLILLTVLMGLATMVLGYFLGFLTECMEKNYKHAVGKLGWIGTIVAGALLVATLLFNVFGPGMLLAAGGVLGVSVLAIVYAEGPMGLIEIPGVAGNILSYSRIAAVGLSSVIVAMILNDLVLPKPEQGLWLIITLPLFLFGHLFNAVLGMFESLVQGSRLNFVEFFSKFHHGGGEKFAPFRCERKHTLGG
ncbi:MAG: V-type ATP synthase subunit I [Candidatus Diapherotrites archaeon]|uniref:A-type ATP synthase subunit I n=1 Tax=Candidatus Iainarchaeum sp. TaxID=3101447 RepID=A0A8T4L9U1_9ARCH|nr:V-type ATP synthase subunit I [Candidatus Diapherotrites archaeon]